MPDPYTVDVQTSSSAHAQGGEIDAPQDPCKHWVRVVGRYEDRWQTPMAGAEFKLLINGAVVLEKEYLKDYEQVGLTRGVAPQTDAQREAYEELGTYMYRNCDQGEAQAVILHDPGAEADVQDLRDGISARLDGGYRNLKEKMAPYQAEFDRLGWDSVVIALAEGAGESASNMIDSAAETLDKAADKAFSLQFWRDVGDAIEEGFFETLDVAEEAYEGAKDLAEHAYENRGVLLDDAWWDKKLDDAGRALEATEAQIKETLSDAADAVERSAKQAKAVYDHKEAIMALPGQIVAGDVDGIEAFIDTALRDIDPEMADKLQYDSSWQGAIELLQDGETAAVMGVYLDLFLTVVPPNFWAYAFGRAGPYILVEIILLIIGALLGGVGAAARIAVITARLARMGATMAKIGKLADKAIDAVRAAVKMIEAFTDSVTDIEKLKKKLLLSRRRSTRNGRTNSTLDERRDTEERDGRCRVCRNTSHNTPVDRRGEVDYI